MSHKTGDVQLKDWRFDLVTEATGVPAVYPFHNQMHLWSSYTDEQEVYKTVSLVHENGFRTAVINSLFLDRRADPDDPIPAHVDDKRGWVGDGFFVSGDRMGSKLWMLRFIGKQTNEPDDPVLKYAKAWTQQALQWFIDDGICDHIIVTTWYPRTEVLRIAIQMYQNDNLIYKSQWERFRDDIANPDA